MIVATCQRFQTLRPHSAANKDRRAVFTRCVVSLGPDGQKGRQTMSQSDSKPMCIIVCGPSGCGKSTIGTLLAAKLGVPFLDADSFHPPGNIEKMQSGQPLTDSDRHPWLLLVAAAIESIAVQPAADTPSGSGLPNRPRSGSAHAGRVGCVVGCSALRAAYRRQIEQGAPLSRMVFALLDVPVPELRARLKAREREGKHFMPASLLDSQLATLERGDDLILVPAGRTNCKGSGGAGDSGGAVGGGGADGGAAAHGDGAVAEHRRAALGGEPLAATSRADDAEEVLLLVQRVLEAVLMSAGG